VYEDEGGKRIKTVYMLRVVSLNTEYRGTIMVSETDNPRQKESSGTEK